MINPEAMPADAELEWRIQQQAERLTDSALTPDEQLMSWFEFTRLHAMRSPERVAEMEMERGLR